MKHLPTVLVAVVLGLALMWLHGKYRDANTRWHAAAEAVQLMAARNAMLSDSLVMASHSHAARADSLLSVADSLRALRPRLVVRIDSVPVPAEAVQYTAPRDTLIAILTTENDTLRSAVERLRYAYSDALAANALLRESADSLSAVLDRRPRPRSPLFPSLGVGVMAGVCSDMRPCTGIGITLSWKVSL